MEFKSGRWIGGAATVAALLGVIQLFRIMSLSISQSATFTVLFAGGFCGFQRLWAFLAEMLVIAIKRPPPERKCAG